MAHGARRRPRADAAAPARRGRSVPHDRGPAGSAHPAHVRVRGHRHHVLPGAQDRERARGAARPVQPACAGRSRRRADRASRDATSSWATSCCSPRGTACRPTACCSTRCPSRSTSRCSPANRSPSASARRRRTRHWTDPAATTRRASSRPRSWSKGQGIMLVKATGGATALGRIGGALSDVETERTPLQLEVDRLVRIVATLAISLCAVLVVVYGITQGPDDPATWLRRPARRHHARDGHAARRSSRSSSRCSWRWARGGSRASACSRGACPRSRRSARRPCSPRTRPARSRSNRMTVRELRPFGERTPSDRRRGRRAARAAARDRRVLDPRQPGRPVRPDGHGVQGARRAATSPTPSTSTATGASCGSTRCPSICWRCRTSGARSTGDDFVIAAKGAPEAIADLCHLSRRGVRAARRQRSPRWPIEGCACSASRAPTSRRRETCPAEQHDFDFEFMGLVGLEDPVRDDVPARRRAGAPRRRARRDDHRRLPGHRSRRRRGGRARDRRRS